MGTCIYGLTIPRMTWIIYLIINNPIGFSHTTLLHSSTLHRILNFLINYFTSQSNSKWMLKEQPQLREARAASLLQPTTLTAPLHKIDVYVLFLILYPSLRHNLPPSSFLSYSVSFYKVTSLIFPSTQGSQEGSLFSGLTNQKRSNSDAAAKARRESFADQAPKAGFMGSMWNRYVVILGWELMRCWLVSW